MLKSLSPVISIPPSQAPTEVFSSTQIYFQFKIFAIRGTIATCMTKSMNHRFFRGKDFLSVFRAFGPRLFSRPGIFLSPWNCTNLSVVSFTQEVSRAIVLIHRSVLHPFPFAFPSILLPWLQIQQTCNQCLRDLNETTSCLASFTRILSGPLRHLLGTAASLPDLSSGAEADSSDMMVTLCSVPSRLGVMGQGSTVTQKKAIHLEGRRGLDPDLFLKVGRHPPGRGLG